MSDGKDKVPTGDHSSGDRGEPEPLATSSSPPSKTSTPKAGPAAPTAVPSPAPAVPAAAGDPKDPTATAKRERRMSAAALLPDDMDNEIMGSMVGIDGIDHSKFPNVNPMSKVYSPVAPPGMNAFGHHFSTKSVCIFGTVSVVVIGVVLGFTLKPVADNPPPWDRISATVGWWYFNAWILSFVPQLYLNYVRQCVVGQSFAFLFLNVFGYFFYSVYTIAFYANSHVQEEYMERFHESNVVQLNDVGFGVWACLLCVFNSWQVYIYDRGTQKMPRTTLKIIGVSMAIYVLWLAAILVLGEGENLNILDWLYGISLAKLCVTMFKYLPQIHLNYVRRTTVGWNIYNVMLDFAGGFLSCSQEILDCAVSGKWDGIAGNPVKFGLGFFSCIYDAIMMMQHFVWYKENNKNIQNAAFSGEFDNETILEMTNVL